MQSNTDRCLVWAVQLSLRVLVVCTFFSSATLVAQCTLSCPSGLNLSIAGPSFGCESTIRPIDIGVIAPSCTGLIDLDLYSSTNQLFAGDISASGARVGVINALHIGMQVRARVTHRASGNNCDINLSIVDGLAPNLMLSDTIVSILQNLDPVQVGGDFMGPLIKDCSSTTANYTDSIAQGGCSSTAYAKTFRTWIVTDAYANSSTIRQEISRIAVDLDSIRAPQDTSVSCANGIPTSQPMGLPIVRFGGIAYELPTMSGSEANLFWSYTDESFAGSGGTAQLLRSYRFFDACSPAVSGQNPRTLVQRISVVDTAAPVFSTNVDTLYYSTNTTNCQASISLPVLSVSDDCTNSPEVNVRLNNQILFSNGGYYGDLPLGTYDAVYTATDLSNNGSTKNIVVVVRDQNAPVLITQSSLQVSLSSSGLTNVFPLAFDQGTFDDCTSLSWSIRKSTDSLWSASVEVSCENLNEALNVEIRSCDQFGNCNSRSAEIDVFDYLPPTIFTPPNLTIDCSFSGTDYSTFGQVFISDNCAFALEDSVIVNRDLCGVGYIERFWTALDASGNFSSASQRIEFQASHNFRVSDIHWPRDTSLSTCSQLDPSQLPVKYSVPTWNAVACSDIITSHSDQRIDGPSGTCEVLFRTWTVIDDCRFDGNSAGIWTHVQQINLVDLEPPTISLSADTVRVVISMDSCRGGFFPDGIFSFVDCSVGDAEIRFYDGAQMLTRHSFVDAAYFIPKSSDRAELVVADQCGNSAVVDVPITFIDDANPIAICVDTLIYQVHLDATTFHPELIDLGSQDFCGEPLFSVETNFVPSCATQGWNRVELIVTDSAGLQDVCFTEVQVIDTADVCPIESTTVFGKITTNNNFPIPTRFDLISTFGDTVSTYFAGADGEFSFDVEFADSVTVVPSSNYDPPRFISTFDLFLISQHILGTREFTDPLKRFAGDANRGRSITAFDMTLLRRLILGLNPDLPHHTSVRYIPDTADLTLPDIALMPGIPINDSGLDSTRLSWHSVKLGDVSGTRSAQTSLLTTRSESLLSLRWREVESGTWVLEYTGSEDVLLYGLGLWVNKASAIVDESLQEGLLTAQSEDGLAMSWLSSSIPLSLKHGARILAVPSTQRPVVDLDKSDAVVATDVLSDPEERKISVHYSELELEKNEGLNVYPNPAKVGTFLRVATDQLTISSLRLVDARGVITELNVESGVDVGGLLPSSLTPGVYALQGRYADGKTFEQRILVSR